MNLHEAICKQIKHLRDCQETSAQDRQTFAEAENELKRDKAIASMEIALGEAKTDKGEPMTANNAEARKAYVEWKTIETERTRNLAKESRDSSAEKVDIEKSILSALKDLRSAEDFDVRYLSEYEI